MSHRRLVEAYYAACSAGDLDGLHATLHPDVVHYFLAPNVGSAPVAGREHLARYWRKVQARIEATWLVEHAVEQGDEIVIEWAMWWRPPGSDARVVTRGAEWFVVESGLLKEIRSYYQQREQSTELDGFPYGDRGYSRPG